MKALCLLALLSIGCSFGPAPAMSVGAECPLGDSTLQIEVGHFLLDPANPQKSCAALSETLDKFRQEFEARFGHQEMIDWVVRLRATQDLRTAGVSENFPVGGHTYDGAIDLAAGEFAAFAHELNHVRKGLGHGGWCVDYEPWSESVLGVNQRGYLGCKP